MNGDDHGHDRQPLPLACPRMIEIAVQLHAVVLGILDVAPSDDLVSQCLHGGKANGNGDQNADSQPRCHVEDLPLPHPQCWPHPGNWSGAKKIPSQAFGSTHGCPSSITLVNRPAVIHRSAGATGGGAGKTAPFSLRSAHPMSDLFDQSRRRPDARMINIRGARQHNLKGIDVEIPRDKLVVLTGLSGSGKPSLAFDTIYAEGQRRYVESLSAYARQFLDQMRKPDIDSIEGLSPAISIEQKSGSRNPRSTVGTITEIYDYLRLLWARVGQVFCWSCGQPIASQTIQKMVDQILELPEGARFSVLAPVVRDRKGEYATELAKLRQEGFVRANIDGELYELSEPPKLDKAKKHTIEVFVDRLVRKDGIRQRLTDSVELAAKLAGGVVKISPLEGEDMLFSEKFACSTCGISYPEIAPRLFSFNNPAGACPACDGIGAKMFFDPDLIVPNEELSLKEGAIEPWERRNSPFFHQILDALAAHYDIDQYVPWGKLPQKTKDLILHGSAGEEVEFSFEKNGRKHTYKKDFEGVLANLQRRFDEYERRRREQGRTSEQDFEAIYDEFHR